MPERRGLHARVGDHGGGAGSSVQVATPRFHMHRVVEPSVWVRRVVPLPLHRSPTSAASHTLVTLSPVRADADGSAASVGGAAFAASGALFTAAAASITGGAFSGGALAASWPQPIASNAIMTARFMRAAYVSSARRRLSGFASWSPLGVAPSYTPRMRASFVLPVLVGVVGIVGGCGDDLTGPFGTPQILVHGVGIIEDDCRVNICPHNENTDLTTFDGAIYLVHRTAESQVLGPNSALRVYRSTDGGKTFAMLAILPAPTAATYPDFGDRDLRDPSFDVVDGKLAMKALIRLPVTSMRDANVDTITIGTVSNDGGTTWSPFTPLTTPTTGDGWSFWRIRSSGGIHYSAAYEDGDKDVRLFSSPDGKTWTMGAEIYGVATDTPLETEIVFMPSGRMLALVRMDGTDDEILGNVGRLRTKVCWAMPPYDHFDCPQELTGVRLDGPVAFFHDDRLFVVARKHLIEIADRKRTAVYELTGTLEGGPLAISELGVLPSAGDTAYAGAADVDADHVLVTWYSSNVGQDGPWARTILEASDIWQTTFDMRTMPLPTQPLPQ